LGIGWQDTARDHRCTQAGKALRDVRAEALGFARYHGGLAIAKISVKAHVGQDEKSETAARETAVSLSSIFVLTMNI
jgi:hypothetical protein